MKHRSKSRTTKFVVLSTAVGALLMAVALPSLTGAPKGPQSDFEPYGDSFGWQGLPSRIRHVRTGMILVLIEPGTAQLGSSDTELQRDADEVSREVRIESPFYLGETEVTIAEWRAVQPELPVENEFVESTAFPVQGVSWYAAQALVQRLNDMGSQGWRLPSDDEWEYACRAGTRSPFSFGDLLSPQAATYNSARPYADAVKETATISPTRVRSHSPNPWGLYDMHGNVWEWCEDPYFVDPTSDVVGLEVKSGAARVLRGGSWTSKGTKLRSASREGYSPNSSGSEYGVRMALTVPAEFYTTQGDF